MEEQLETSICSKNDQKFSKGDKLPISNIEKEIISKGAVGIKEKSYAKAEVKDIMSSNSDLELISEEEVEKANVYEEELLSHHQKSKVEEISCHSSSEKDMNSSTKKPERKEEFSEDSLKKILLIEDVLRSDPIDLERLRELAKEEGGFIKDELRRRAWPQLMQVDKVDFDPKPPYEDIKLHKDYNQVVMDVKRSLKRFPPGIDEDYRLILMNQLTTLIVHVLEKHSHLNYYQGYHDVAITFLLVMGESVGFELVEKLSLTHLHEFMRPSMERTTYYLTYLYPVLKRANRKLYDYLIKSRVGTVFCLPWLITWYAHTLSDYRNVVRLYDFFLATPYLMPMYIAVAIVLHREADIFAEECDMAMQHFVLSQVQDTLPFEEILRKASELYSLYPPDDMQEEVDFMFKQKIIEEEEERKKAQQKRRKLPVVGKEASGVVGILTSLSARFYLSHQQKKYAKIVVFAFTATLATGIYGYYTNSPYFKSYLPWL